MAKNRTAVSNEELVAALLTSCSITQAAEKAGMSTRALYDRMTEKDFKILYNGAKADIVRQAVCNLNSHLTGAVEVIAEIMSDSTQNAATRLQAAKMVMEYAARFAERLETADNRTTESMSIFAGLNF